jgi:hypothetical protein
MSKIKPFIWEKSPVGYTVVTNNEFGGYGITEFSIEENPFHLRGFGKEIGQFETLELAKQFAFDDFKKRLERTINKKIKVHENI